MQKFDEFSAVAFKFVGGIMLAGKYPQPDLIVRAPGMDGKRVGNRNRAVFGAMYQQ